MSMLMRRHRKAKAIQHEPSPPVKEIFPKHTGGGWYELSNGEKVQGKDEAKDAQKEVGD